MYCWRQGKLYILNRTLTEICDCRIDNDWVNGQSRLSQILHLSRGQVCSGQTGCMIEQDVETAVCDSFTETCDTCPLDVSNVQHLCAIDADVKQWYCEFQMCVFKLANGKKLLKRMWSKRICECGVCSRQNVQVHRQGHVIRAPTEQKYRSMSVQECKLAQIMLGVVV